MHFGHVLTALVTPFDAKGNVNFPTLTELIERLIHHGTEGFVITGTTGESPVLSFREKGDIYKHVVSVVNKRVPVLAGTGTNDTKKTIQLTKMAEAQNVDGIMLVSPYYNRPNQEGLYKHFATVANETSLPIMLYNIPSRCGVLIEAETIIELSKMDNIVAIKEASGNLELATTVAANTPDNFYLYSGDDSMTLPLMAIGATGVVSVASHIIGTAMNKMVHSFLQGNTVEAALIHRKMFPVMKGLFMAPSPAPVKAALKMQGVDVGSVRLPLVDVTDEEKERLNNIISEIESIS